MSVDKGNWFVNQEEVENKTQNLDANGNLTGTTGTYIADGAIALTDRVAVLDSSSATADMTLAGGEIGQKLSICCLHYTSSCKVTIASLGESSGVLTFSAAGEAVELVYAGAYSGPSGGWFVVGNNGAVIS